MPVTTTYPGVYVEEIPSGVRPIAGVGTSVTAFVGYTKRGPLHEPVQIFNLGDYERHFGDLHRDSELSYAVQQYFLNGGRQAWVVRVASGSSKASLVLRNRAAAPVNVLEVEARTHGAWGNGLRLDVDYATRNPESTFNLAVSEFAETSEGAALVRSETFQELSLDSASPDYVERKVNATSELVRVRRAPNLDGTFFTGLEPGWSLSRKLPSLAGGLTNERRFVAVSIDGEGPFEVPLFAKDTGASVDTAAKLRKALEDAIRTVLIPAFQAATATLTKADGTVSATPAENTHLRVVSGTSAGPQRERSSVRLMSASTADAAAFLGLGTAQGGRERDAVAAVRPAPTGTLGEELLAEPTLADGATFTVRVVTPSGTLTRNVALSGAVASRREAAERLQTALRDGDAPAAFREMRVVAEGTRLRLVTGVAFSGATVEVADGASATALKINVAAATENVQRYALGGTGGVAGVDGTPPNGSAIRGSAAQKQGIHALEHVDLFNILCIPRTAFLPAGEAKAVIDDALAYAQRRRAFYVIDPPQEAKTREAVKKWVEDNLVPHRNGAVYFPHVVVPDPLDGYRPRALPPSGTVAGVYARTDGERGVWKAPAGTDAVILGTLGLAAELTDDEHGTLNPGGINVLRRLPNFGTVVWGSRTVRATEDSEWKYVPVRRTALFLEESLYRGTHWVVFEPNDEPLWSQIRLNVGAFMDTLFRQGAFAGASPKEAYFVRCDATTTTRDDRNRGVVNIVVGWAPLKPAEFVVLRFTQLAGQTQA